MTIFENSKKSHFYPKVRAIPTNPLNSRYRGRRVRLAYGSELTYVTRLDPKSDPKFSPFYDPFLQSLQRVSLKVS